MPSIFVPELCFLSKGKPNQELLLIALERNDNAIVIVNGVDRLYDPVYGELREGFMCRS